jgi:hypothetical protein
MYSAVVVRPVPGRTITGVFVWYQGQMNPALVQHGWYSTTSVPFHYLRSIPLVQVNFFLGFSSGVFSVISLYCPVYFVPLGKAGEFYLEVFHGR